VAEMRASCYRSASAFVGVSVMQFPRRRVESDHTTSASAYREAQLGHGATWVVLGARGASSGPRKAARAV